MKKLLLNSLLKFAVILFIAFSTNVNGQVNFTLGDSVGSNTATTYPAPHGDWYKTHRQQYLFLASELSAAGMGAGDISEISWWVQSSLSVPGLTEGYTIKMKNTATTDLGGAWEDDVTIVYGPMDNTPTMGEWNSFEFDSPFYWDGESNLLIEICGGLAAGTYTYNSIVGYSSHIFNASRTYRSDTYADDVCAYTGIVSAAQNPTRRPVTRFTAAAGDDCTGTPDAGSAIASAESVCTIDELIVSITPVLGFGITYQWENSTDGGDTWNPIIGAEEASYTTYQEVSTSYRCVVTCIASGESSTSGEVTVGQNAATDCYCEPVYTSGTGFGDYCSYVGIGTISNATDGAPAPYYTYYSDLSTDLTAGSEYTLEATTGSYISSNGLAAWIDFNADGDFNDEGELLGSEGSLGAFTSSFFVFTVPGDAVIGETRLRVREIYFIPADPDACADASYGETEDYNVMIMEGGAEICTPVAPAGVYAGGIGSTSAVIYWDAVSNADQYVGAIYNLSTGSIRKFKPTGDETTYDLTSLTASTTYGVRMKTVCYEEGIISAYSEWYYFTTDPLREGEFVKDIAVYPNPNNGNFRIQLNGYESGVAQVTIVNSVGQSVYDATVSVDNNASVHEVSLQMAAGTYFVKVINGTDIATNTIIVE